MKVSIEGTAKLENGGISIPFHVNDGKQDKVINLPFRADMMPGNIWESMLAAMTIGDPHKIRYSVKDEDDKMILPSQRGKSKERFPDGLAVFGINGSVFWLYRGKVVETIDMERLSDEEQKLEVANVVLKHEKRYTLLRRQQEAYARIENTDAARRERIPDDVRLFVWQRDEGKCVKCGGTEKLEFDHIIPVAKGGSNTERNIQLLCEACNRAKGTNL
ncbi:MAG: HNH endonuclease signature motif containing protein [Phycisphaerae bacterium]|nr:HNH endonuclease signature motif containing protein [Phycisphaerae bacterium]